MRTLIYGGHLIDPANRVDAHLNILIENGRVASVTEDMPNADEPIDATGKVVCPGFIDIHMHEDPIERTVESTQIQTARSFTACCAWA